MKPPDLAVNAPLEQYGEYVQAARDKYVADIEHAADNALRAAINHIAKDPACAGLCFRAGVRQHGEVYLVVVTPQDEVREIFPARDYHYVENPPEWVMQLTYVMHCMRETAEDGHVSGAYARNFEVTP